MRRVFAVTTLILAFAFPTAMAESFGVSMHGANEIPNGDVNGVGFADLILDGTTLSYSVVVFNIDTPTAMHIHPGARSQVGPPLVPFTTLFVRQEGCPSLQAPPCTERFVNVGEVEISAATAEALSASPSDFYLNVHNAAFPGGAIRGQVRFARYLPIVGQTPGAAESHWFTRFAVLNRSLDREAGWSVEFVPQSPEGNTARLVADQQSLPAMSLSSGSDFFPESEFNGIGSMRILSDRPLTATAAVYNGVGSARGDLGFAVQAKPLEDAETSGALIDLATSSGPDMQARTGHRSNIGYFNPQVVAVEATFRARDHDGRLLGQRAVLIPPGGMAQSPVFDLIPTAVTDRVQETFWIDWSATAPIFVYATVVNNHTGDPELRD
jgi:hypothetical protein